MQRSFVGYFSDFNQEQNEWNQRSTYQKAGFHFQHRYSKTQDIRDGRKTKAIQAELLKQFISL
jgi:hypothetical protein